MSEGQDYISRIKGYRERSFAARQLEEDALLHSMEDMGAILGDLKAIKAADTPYFPIHIHDVSYVVDVNEYDDFMNGARLLIQRDGNKISKISMILRNDRYEEEKIFTPTIRTVDLVKHWKDETYCRRGEGIELKAQEITYSSAEQAAKMIRLAVINAAVTNISHGHYHISDNIPLLDAEAAVAVKRNIEEAISTRNDIEARRVAQRNNRLNTTNTLEIIWLQAESELSFLKELGYEFDDAERPLSITWQKGEASLSIKVTHDFGQYSTIDIKTDDKQPNVVSLSVGNSEGIDELVSNFSISESNSLKSELKKMVLQEIEQMESSWVPEEEYEQTNFLSM